MLGDLYGVGYQWVKQDMSQPLREAFAVGMNQDFARTGTVGGNTVFRFPLRTNRFAEGSKIKSTVSTTEDIRKIFRLTESKHSSLLLFLKHLTSV